MKSISLKMLRNGALSAAITVVVGAGFMTTPTPAYAIYCSNCSTMWQQVMQYGKDVETALNTAQQLSTQIQQYQNMVQQGLSLPSSLFNQITGQLQQITSVYNNAKSLGREISNFDDKFKDQFKNYDNWLKTNNFTSQAAADRYEAWSEQGLDNARTAMKAAGMNVDGFSDENAMLAQIVSRSQSASGRLQAIQAGNEIAAQNVQQLQKLRDLVATQITLQGNYMAQYQERQSVDDAFREKFNSGTVKGTGATKGY